NRMVVWGGYYYIPPPLGRTFILDTGGRYDPATDSWAPTSSLNAPVARYSATSVWSGSAVLVWGGNAGSGAYPNTGGRYDPSADTWAPMTATNAPSGRERHTAVWTGDRMIVWGGEPSTTDTGGRYDPAGDAWAS